MPILHQKQPTSPPSPKPQSLLEPTKIWPCIRKSVDNIMKVTKLLNITKGWRNSCLNRKVMVVMYLFVWSPIQKSRSLSHGWCNHNQWRRLWLLVLLLLRVSTDCDSLAGGKIWSVSMHTVLGIVGLKMSNLALKPVSDESFCPRTLALVPIILVLVKLQQIALGANNPPYSVHPVLPFHNTRNFLTFVNTTAIAYGQKIDQSLRILVACNSSRVYRRRKVTSRGIRHVVEKSVPRAPNSKLMRQICMRGGVRNAREFLLEKAALPSFNPRPKFL